MRFPIAVVALAAALPAAGQVGPRSAFETRYFYDEDKSSLSFTDVQFVSTGHGIAIGVFEEKGKVRMRGALTTDSGGKWELVDLPDESASLFLLNERQAWIAGGSGIYHSRDGGRKWNRVSRLDKALRVHFLDEKRGFAIGFEKKVWHTVNGGEDWKEIPAADELKADPRRSAFNWIDFITPEAGFITGYHQSDRRTIAQFPEWMDPENYRKMRQLPALSLLLQTSDGGATWKASAASIMGRVTRHRAIPSGRRLTLVEYDQSFDWPSEVYRTFDHGKETASAFREKDRAITDIALLPNGVGYLAGYAPSGALARLPIPGRVAIYRSADLANWEPVEVDYRAVARRVYLSAPRGGGVWAATDTGMILQLVAR